MEHSKTNSQDTGVRLRGAKAMDARLAAEKESLQVTPGARSGHC
jgi:hypothetical protein